MSGFKTVWNGQSRNNGSNGPMQVDINTINY